MKTVIGDNCAFLANSHIGHDCHVGSNVVMSNNVLIAGHVTLGDFVIIGRRFRRRAVHPRGCARLHRGR